eukprot:7386469-Prymnesium_polylepis.1
MSADSHDERWMSYALRLSERGRLTTAPNPWCAAHRANTQRPISRHTHLRHPHLPQGRLRHRRRRRRDGARRGLPPAQGRAARRGGRARGHAGARDPARADGGRDGLRDAGAVPPRAGQDDAPLRRGAHRERAAARARGGRDRRHLRRRRRGVAPALPAQPPHAPALCGPQGRAVRRRRHRLRGRHVQVDHRRGGSLARADAARDVECHPRGIGHRAGRRPAPHAAPGRRAPARRLGRAREAAAASAARRPRTRPHRLAARYHGRADADLHDRRCTALCPRRVGRGRRGGVRGARGHGRRGRGPRGGARAAGRARRDTAHGRGRRRDAWLLHDVARRAADAALHWCVRPRERRAPMDAGPDRLHDRRGAAVGAAARGAARQRRLPRLCPAASRLISLFAQRALGIDSQGARSPASCGVDHRTGPATWGSRGGTPGPRCSLVPGRSLPYLVKPNVVGARGPGHR